MFTRNRRPLAAPQKSILTTLLALIGRGLHSSVGIRPLFLAAPVSTLPCEGVHFCVGGGDFRLSKCLSLFRPSFTASGTDRAVFGTKRCSCFSYETLASASLMTPDYCCPKQLNMPLPEFKSCRPVPAAVLSLRFLTFLISLRLTLAQWTFCGMYSNMQALKLAKSRSSYLFGTICLCPRSLSDPAVLIRKSFSCYFTCTLEGIRDKKSVQNGSRNVSAAEQGTYVSLLVAVAQAEATAYLPWT